MALIRLTKQPAENRLFDFEFAGKLRTGETISSVISITSTPTGLTVGANTISGSIVQVRLSSGTDQTEYLLTCKITTSLSNTLETEGLLWVEDITEQSLLKQAALDELIVMCQADICPALDYSTEKSELRIILAKHMRASVWTLSTVYNLGDEVIPTSANRTGLRYIAVDYTDTGTDQKSDTAEPTWPTVRDTQITDNHVIWQENGFDYDGELWDLNEAAKEAWLAKAAKASPTSDVQTDALSIKSSQLFDHCIQMSKQFQPYYVL